jgi:hypothetical protein
VLLFSKGSMDNVSVSRLVLIWLLAFAGLAKAQTQTNFFIQNIQMNPDSSVTITWPALPQIPYHVMYADTPTGMWQNFSDGTLTAGSNVSSLGYTDTSSLAVTQRFYKVGAPRLPVIMTLVLDRSGSMDPTLPLVVCQGQTQGGLYLPSAVTQFINIFDETVDRAALVTFASSSSNDVRMSAIGGQFKIPIINTMTRISSNNLWAGGTCTMAGLTNALVIQNSINAPNAVKIVVLFTDGQANMITGLFTNTTPAGGITLNFGGQDPVQPGCGGANPGASFFRTNAAETVAAQNASLASVTCDGSVTFSIGGTNVNTTLTYTDLTGTHFYCADSITEDATNRCVLIANQMRASSNYVYVVRLAAPGGIAPPILTTLQQIANDPGSSTFDPTRPVGAALLSDGNDLAQVFQQIAADIMVRLVP